jgi:WD40 repeat protein/tRNA A-37 threonylcarbamoyl transferase component Bud32
MPDHDRFDNVDAVVAACIEARRSGERSTYNSLLQEYSQFAPDVVEFFDDYESVDEKFTPLRELLGGGPQTTGEMPTLDSEPSEPTVVPQPGSLFGDYELLSEIARGGMGVVFKARQQRLDRIVALKLLLGGGQSRLDRERFLVEAQAVARLSHPQIVPIYEVGEEAGCPYFTMELFSGGSLRERIEELRGNQRTAARLMSLVARGVDHAHRRGILHRDLKPSNILLDDHGAPHVTDFGLAKRLDEQSGLTRAGAVVGTPSYMAPEQALAATDLSTAVDVYGLGAVLYELLTGRPPFKGATALDTIYQSQTRTPELPRASSPKTDVDLEAICLKCLAKDPQARYGSADDVADDLERWLSGMPVHARKVTVRRRLAKWAQRQPLLATAAAAVCCAIVALLILSGFLWHSAELRATAVEDLNQAKAQLSEITAQRRSADKERIAAEILAAGQRKIAADQTQLADRVRGQVADAKNRLATIEGEARHTRYAADMLLLHAAWEGGNLTAASDVFDRYRQVAGSDDLLGFEWHYLYRQFHGERLSWRDPSESGSRDGSILAIAISPDNQLLATAQSGGKLALRNLADGRLLRELETTSGTADKPGDKIAGLFFTDSGSRLTTVVRRPPNERQADWSVPAAASAALVVSPSLLATSSPNGYALTKSALDAVSSSSAVRAGRAFIEEALANHDSFKIESLAEALEYRSYALDEPKQARIERFDASQLRSTVLPLRGPFSVSHQGRVIVVLALDRSPDGRFLALAGAEPDAAERLELPGAWSGAFANGTLIIWDLAAGRVHAVQQSAAAVTAVNFSPSGGDLAVGHSDGAVDLIGPDLADRPRSLTGHDGWVYALKFSRDGRRLASGARDGLVLLWDVAQAKEAARLRGHSSAVCQLDLSPDGRTLVSAGTDGTVKVWDLAQVGQSRVFRGSETFISGVGFNDQGDQLTALDFGGAVRTWRLTDGELLRMTKPQDTDGLRLCLSASGKTTAFSGNGGSLLVRDLSTNRQTRLEWSNHRLSGLSISPDDRLIAAADLTGQGGLQVWNIASSKQVASLDAFQKPDSMPVYAGTFSFDAKSFALAQAGSVLVWDWQSGRPRSVLESHGEVATALAFSHNTKLIAAAARPKDPADPVVVHIWDIAANHTQAECRGAGQEVASLAFSPDGRRLATGGSTSAQQGVLKLWDTEGGREVFFVQFPMATITAVAFSPDGRRLAAAVTPVDLSTVPTGKAPSDVYVWDATPIPENKSH